MFVIPRRNFKRRSNPSPPLEIDGKVFAESRALLEYACALSGSVASDPLELLAHNIIIDRMADQFKHVYPLLRATSEEERAAALPAANANLKELWTMLDGMVKNYSGTPNHILRDKPFCPADLLIYCNIRQLNTHHFGIDIGDIASQFPHMYAIYQGVMDSNPKIVAYHPT
eukprot:Blabericola_migrator_1__7142@NODE_3618_length_1630_cov_3381_789507_g2243_i0_p2_GENE_NODE_3618_length_1630_cov_3381_789507_g2243_i0NODE_3618_length_1630_cov_3381_789507_g2243_i0_p2_ORF_typecomplete_len171_score29_54GST_C_3/PF14497_6/7e05_NODE_3618_length_1630_cov_3381_789507_g2243_i0212724